MTKPELQRAVPGTRRRRRYAVGIAFAAGVAVHAAAVAGIARWRAEAEPRAEAVAEAEPRAEAEAETEAVPAALPVLGGCPAPVLDVGAPVVAALGEPVTHAVASSTDARWIAAWNARSVFVSDDGGASFARVLDAAERVLDAAFDCHGRLYVLRDGDWLGVRDGERELWHVLDSFAEPPRLVGGGPVIAAIGTADDAWQAQRVGFSADGGASWRYGDEDSGEVGPSAVVIDRDGWLRAAMPWWDGDHAGVALLQRSAAGARAARGGVPGPIEELAFAGAWLYARTSACGADEEGGATLCSWSGDAAAWQRVRWPDSDEPLAWNLVSNGAIAHVVGNTHAWPLAGDHVGPSRPWPPMTWARTVDAAGRLWAVDIAGRLLRP